MPFRVKCRSRRPTVRPLPVVCFGEHLNLDNDSVRAFFYSLQTNSDWVDRRVQSFWLIDGEDSKQKASIDIDVAKVKEVARTTEVAETPKMLIPIGFLRKGLLLDFSVSGQDGQPLSLMKSDKDELISKGILLHHLKNQAEYSDIVGSLSERQIEEIEKDILKLTSPMNTVDKLELLPKVPLHLEVFGLSTTHALRKAILSYLKQRTGCNQYETWYKLLEIEDFVSLLKVAITHFIPVVEIPTADSRYIVKYETRESSQTRHLLKNLDEGHLAQCQEEFARLELPDGDWKHFKRSFMRKRWRTRLKYLILFIRQWMGLLPFELALDTSLVGHDSREHIRIICPPGICIASFDYEHASVQSVCHDRSVEMFRITRERAMLYTRATTTVFDTAKACRARVGLRPRLTGFGIAALVVVLVGLLLGLVSHFQASVVLAGCESQIDALMTILLLSTSFASFYVARPDEHKYRCSMLVFPRGAVFASGISVAFIAAVALFFNNVDLMRISAFASSIISGLILVYLCVFMARSNSQRSIVLRNASCVKETHFQSGQDSHCLDKEKPQAYYAGQIDVKRVVMAIVGVVLVAFIFAFI